MRNNNNGDDADDNNSNNMNNGNNISWNTFESERASAFSIINLPE